MNNASYVGLSRQAGLMREMQTIANNMANINTVGFKREGAVFSEYVAALKPQNMQVGLQNSPSHSLSIGRLSAHVSNLSDGGLRASGGTFDLALQGDGFFTVQIGGQTQLTRAGNFISDETGRLVTVDGAPVLNSAGGEIQIPPEAQNIKISRDGTISAEGNEIGQIGVVTTDPLSLSRTGQNNWTSNAPLEPVGEPAMAQGYLEDSNVQPMLEIARMIEVQRHYDAGQKILETEDQRIKQVITSVRQSA